MAEPPEFWSFIVANSLLFVAGGSLTVLSYRAYLRMQQYSLRLASGGFALITLGGLTDIIYQLGVRRNYNLAARESLALQTIDSLLITAGLVVIFYALSRYWLFTSKGCRTLCFGLGVIALADIAYTVLDYSSGPIPAIVDVTGGLIALICRSGSTRNAFNRPVIDTRPAIAVDPDENSGQSSQIAHYRKKS